jgi:hypothetical protein
MQHAPLYPDIGPFGVNIDGRVVKLTWGLHVDVAMIEVTKRVRSIAPISGFGTEEHAIRI